ncbi:hypothetical protein ACFQWF_10295 [Methylorubrum suomiense]
MPLGRIAFDPRRAEHELSSFKDWLSARATFKERAALTEIRARPHIACLLAYGFVPTPNLIRFEFGVKDCSGPISPSATTVPAASS